MKSLLIASLSFLLITTASAQKPTVEAVLSAYKKSIKNIQRLSYQAHRIDTFPTGGVLNNTGKVLIERYKQDSILGINFWGKRDDVEKEYLYLQGYGYEINPKKGRYTKAPESFGFLGSPGGQMVLIYMMYAEAGHEHVELIEDDQHFILVYTFKDDPDYDLRNQKRWTYLDKETYLPVKFVESKSQLNNRRTKQFTISDIKINETVESTIAQRRAGIEAFKDKSEQKIVAPPSLVGKRHPTLKLPQLGDSTILELSVGEPMLLVFWEFWCGPCIKSLPEIQKMNEQFGGRLRVIGVSAADPVKTALIRRKRGVSFPNLIGNSAILKAYDVNSFPNYFLIDENGIVSKHYQTFDYETVLSDVEKILR